LALGVLAAFAYWTHPTVLHGAVWRRGGFGLWLAIKTLFVWLPLLVSWLLVRNAAVQSHTAAALYALVLVVVSLLVDAALIGVVTTSLTPFVLALTQTVVLAMAALLYRAVGSKGIYGSDN
jgi:hypothetical protein